MNKLKLRRHETFSIREGWIQKGLEAVVAHGSETFQKEHGIKILGLGSNMVKSLKYWMIAGNIIKSQPLKVELTSFGEMLYKYDKYLETNFSWCLFHYFLSTNFDESPIIYFITNIYNRKSFNKEEICDELDKYFKLHDYESNKALVSEDVNMYTRLYIDSEIDNPEDNFVSPLSSLKLLETGYSMSDFIKTPIDPETLDYRVVYYMLQDMFKDSFEVNSVFTEDKSPTKVFNIDKGTFSQYLNIMKNKDLVTINKTAGLNTVYFNKRMSLEEIFNDYFGGK